MSAHAPRARRREPFRRARAPDTMRLVPPESAPSAPSPPARPSPLRLVLGTLLNLVLLVVVLGFAWGNVREFVRDPLRLGCVALSLVPTMVFAAWTSRAGAGVRALDEGRHFVL